MKQHFKLMVPLALMILLLLAGCELRRDGREGDISADTPAPEVVETSPLGPTSPAPTAGPPEAIPEIDPAAVPAPPPPPAEQAEPGKVLVKLTDEAAVQARSAELGSAGISSLDEILLKFEASSLEPVLDDVADVTDQDPDELSIQAEQVGSLFFVTYEADVPPAEVATALEENPSVEYSEPNFIAGVAGSPGLAPNQFEPNDPYYKFQWHYQKIGMPAAWDLSTGSDVVIAVVDTGIDFNAPDLANTGRVPGYDFVNNDDDPTDDQGHGTHVAGTVAQSTNNGVGVAGVAYRARLMPVKTLGSDGNGTYENIIKGIIYAVDRGAQVINLSLAGSSPSASLLDAVTYARSRGVVVVAAAGNAGGPVSYPAAYDEQVLAVAATRFDNARSSYSNFGPQIDLAAPGGDIDVDQTGDGYADGVLQQTRKSGGGYSYQFWEGTSMAAPHVAGLAGLLLAVRPGASPAEIEAVMAQTALQGLGPTDQYGAGVIQADAALRAFAPVPNTPTPTFTSMPPTPTFTSAPPTATFTSMPPTPTFTSAPPTPTFTSMPPTATFTPLPPPPTVTPTPSPTVEPVCTPPPCSPGGSFVCPSGDCPGGCGVICITPTPEPPSPTPTFTPSPTVTPLRPTSTPTPAGPSLPAGELLLNGGFETDEGWTFGDTPVRGDFDTSLARSGSRSARLGIVSPPDRYSFTSAWQKAVIPADAKQVTLTTHIYPVSQDLPGRDAQNILILNSSFRIIRRLVSGVSNAQTWEARSYDLTDLRGQTIYVYFGVFNNGVSNRPTAMFVDDVSLNYTR